MGEYYDPSPKAEAKYRIGPNIKIHAAHHQSFKALWETKWKKPCSMGVYPFMFGSINDFEPIAQRLIAKDAKEPYDWDAYAEEFFPTAETLVQAAERAEVAEETEKAAEFFLRASAVYRISRFPTPRSAKQYFAWSEGKRLFLRGQSLLSNPITQVDIPHIHGLRHEGKIVQAFHLLPENATAIKPAPTVIIYTGLDGYRTELSAWAEGWRRKGVATVIFEIPGTGDSPADRSDPTSPDRQMSSLLDWCDKQPGIDSRNLCLWGFSTGGMYAIRAAHTHQDRLKGVISLGGGCHHMFDSEWLSEVNHLEYPFDLANSLSHKFGYSDPSLFINEASRKYSLLHDGTLEKPCTRLLLVNGTHDEIFPIDDMLLLLQVGPSPKEARFITDTKHMGEPASFAICVNWVYDLFGITGEASDVLKTLPFKAKFDLVEEQKLVGPITEKAETSEDTAIDTVIVDEDSCTELTSEKSSVTDASSVEDSNDIKEQASTSDFPISASNISAEISSSTLENEYVQPPAYQPTKAEGMPEVLRVTA